MGSAIGGAVFLSAIGVMVCLSVTVAAASAGKELVDRVFGPIEPELAPVISLHRAV